jgi:hypothetical protein
MSHSARSHEDDGSDREDETPHITACERSPGTTVFLEKGNTDGWISTDLTVEPWE